MGVASLVLGIIAIAVGLFSFGLFGWLGAIIGIVGIILGVLGKKASKQKGLAIAGLVCSIIGTVVSLFFYIGCVVGIGTFVSI